MKTETISSETAEMMILEGVNDASDDRLAAMLSIMTGHPVKVLEDELLEIDWDTPNEVEI